jgi:hypothetical protein
MTETEQRNKELVLNAFDTLFNKRDYAAAERFWSLTTFSTAPTSNRDVRVFSGLSKPHRPTCATRTH